jgi:hypothetical protein
MRVLLKYGSFLGVVLLLVSSCAQNEENSYSCRPAPAVFIQETEAGGANLSLELVLNSGLFSASPSFAIWAAFSDGTTQSIYTTCKAATGSWDRASEREGLPVWNNLRIKEGIPDSGPQVDAITSATPTRSSFEIHYQIPEKYFNDTIAIKLEFNLPGDYNDYYSSRLGENGQPSIIWRTEFIYTGETLNLISPSRIIGRSHATGEDGKVYGDLIGITTAIDLVDGLVIKAL